MTHLIFLFQLVVRVVLLHIHQLKYHCYKVYLANEKEQQIPELERLQVLDCCGAATLRFIRARLLLMALREAAQGMLLSSLP